MVSYAPENAIICLHEYTLCVANTAQILLCKCIYGVKWRTKHPNCWTTFAWKFLCIFRISLWPVPMLWSPKGTHDLGISSWWPAPHKNTSHFCNCTAVHRMVQYFTLLQSVFNNSQDLTSYTIKSSICTNVLFAMPFTNAAVSLFPNFLLISFQQSIMQDFKSIIQHSFKSEPHLSMCFQPISKREASHAQTQLAYLRCFIPRHI